MIRPKRPLEGRSILVTRPLSQSDSLFSQIKEKGGIPLSFPVVTIQGADVLDNRSVFNNLDSYQWIIFTSMNGVNYFFRFIKEAGLSVHNHRFAAVGEKTAQLLKRYTASPVLFPKQFDAPSMVEMLKHHVKKGERVLFPKGNLASSYIKDQLAQMIQVNELVIYETGPNERLDWELPMKADCFFFLSPSAVQFMMSHQEYEKNETFLSKPVFCIGPATNKAARENGFKHVFVSDRSTAESMIKKAAAYYQGGT
jgi:uroporphyrinogen-III synthase